ncbi:MAG: pyridoxine 5'-phosphate synthase [Pyrinomonadaceae bacterium]
MTARLNVNIDHIATVRQARRTIEPSVVAAAMICEAAGADGITVHLRQDRRHIQDSDLEILRGAVSTYLNLEIAATDEMIAIAERVRPDAVSLVPENPGEITTEGGLDVIANFDTIRDAVKKLGEAGIFVSIFVDPDAKQIEAAARAGAAQIEICTAEYAEATLGSRSVHAKGKEKADLELNRINSAAQFAQSHGLVVAAGHGLTTKNVVPLAAIPQITEFNIGHHIISRSFFVGLHNAVREMLAAIASNKNK